MSFSIEFNRNEIEALESGQEAIELIQDKLNETEENLETLYPDWFRVIDGITYVKSAYGLQPLSKD